MITFVAPAGGLAPGAWLDPDADERHHLRVRRAGAGEAVRVVDGAGVVGEGRLARRGRELAVVIETVTRVPPPPPLVLGLGAGDKDRFALVVEKAVELGVTEIIPLETERTRGVATRVRAAHLDRLRRRTVEAVKQCGTAFVPAVSDLVTLEAFVDRPRPGPAWLADAAGSAPGTLAPDAALTCVVGPEGGFDANEQAGLRQAGFQPVRLGPHTLRFETAAIAVLVAAWQARTREAHD